MRNVTPGASGGWAPLVWAGAVGMSLLAAGGYARADVQVSGSVQAGQSSGSVTANGGQTDYRYQSQSLSAAFGRGSGRPGGPINGSRSPYGRLNYGRSGLSDYSIGGNNFVGGVPRDPQWSGLIDQNFEIMRRTSPFPNQYAGGIYNRRPFGHRYGHGIGGFYYPAYGDFSYGGYAFGYSPGYFGSYVPSVYSIYGSWYPPYIPADRVYIIEREIVHDRADVSDRRSDEGERLDSENARRSDEGDYYLSPRSGETVDDVLAEIRHAWMNGDFTRLKSRIRGNGKVRIYLKGKYKYSVDASDFAQMTRDAMERIDTTSFTLDRVQRRGDDRVFASGKHVYLDPDKQKHEVYVSYVLVKEDGRWRIAEAGSSTEPITAHND